MTTMNTIHRRPAVEKITGLARATIYQQMARGEFPKPVKIGPKAVGWRENDIAAWINSRKHSM